MSTIYVVQGLGRYPDDGDWLVKAFRDQAKAEALMVTAQARNDELTAEYEKAGEPSVYNWGKSRNEHDPEWSAFATYEVVPLELEEA
jgi:hypothetical protein